MKILNLSLTILIALTILSSCGNELSKEEQEFDNLMQQVIDVHDEVMPKMGKISSLIKELEPKIDTTSTGKTYANAQDDLKGAYDFMMEWMGDFSDKFPYEEKNKKFTPEQLAAKMKILQEEEIEVKKMRDQVNSSIENATKLLSQ